MVSIVRLSWPLPNSAFAPRMRLNNIAVISAFEFKPCRKRARCPQLAKGLCAKALSVHSVRREPKRWISCYNAREYREGLLRLNKLFQPTRFKARVVDTRLPHGAIQWSAICSPVTTRASCQVADKVLGAERQAAPSSANTGSNLPSDQLILIRKCLAWIDSGNTEAGIDMLRE